MMLILGVPLMLVIAILVYIAWPWLAILIGIQLESNPPRPEISYGEFARTEDYIFGRFG
ncbi:hypothetical protein D3C76_1865730 [compost metagenome]